MNTVISTVFGKLNYETGYELDLIRAKAIYSLNDDGTVAVSNSGIKSGKYTDKLIWVEQ